MASRRELALRHAALLERGSRQRNRFRQQAETLTAGGERLDGVFRIFRAAAAPPALAGAGALLVLMLGRQRSLRLAAGALGLWATVQRVRQTGEALSLLAKRSG